MKREIIKTADGSHTIYLPDWNENYHSKHGAIQEAYHVFIKTGLEHLNRKDYRILEIGFGTGLNALITRIEALKHKLSINYTGVEAYPVPKEEYNLLNYCEELEGEGLEQLFEQLHQVSWEEAHDLGNDFSLTKQEKTFDKIADQAAYNLIYFDAFGPRVQPELWTEEIFERMYAALETGGVLVTYCAKGSVRRNMQAVGFTVERLPGPPGKREMLRATKP